MTLHDYLQLKLLIQKLQATVQQTAVLQIPIPHLVRQKLDYAASR